ncbi:Uncharacterised protein [Nocardia otitidiscaviarum]|uniref:Uncharacterized protein n=1 Tax=Nocardia otitidiscaviarum TaxID=1823 RepID=A0A379JHD4_9NOCA|nr:Uncharacterised protein [Nocardia otitidiscaviarum]
MHAVTAMLAAATVMTAMAMVTGAAMAGGTETSDEQEA